MRHTSNAFKVALCLLASLLWLGMPARAQEVAGCSLSNFDVQNVDRGQTYDDFELVLLGRVDPGCIQGWYPGWGAKPEVRPGTRFGPGITITWRNSADPIGPGRTEHFGLDLRCRDPLTARGFWSRGGRPAREVALPWQSWQTRRGIVTDVIRMPRFREIGPVSIVRESVVLPDPIPLDRLNWLTVAEIVTRLRLQWRVIDREPKRLAAGGQAVADIPVRPDARAVIVRYTVTAAEGRVSRFINQACISRGCPIGLPKPEVAVVGSEDYVGSDGNPYTRYRVAVTNRAAYPDSLFAPAPDLPPCGTNTSSSRTWVDLYDGNGVRLYGFCGLSSAAALGDLWFAMPRGTPPPACVSVKLTDRRCNQTYTSSCASTPACVDFESLLLGTSYPVGSIFTDAGATMTVQKFQVGSGGWTTDGHASVASGGNAGASGQELSVNNVNVGFRLPVMPSVLFLNFGELGGNLNIEVNGEFRNFQNFADINAATIGGTHVAVTNGGSNAKGTLTLTGAVQSFAVGGQELFLDHVCFTGKPVEREGTWVLPFGVGGTRLDAIKTTGLTDYIDGISGFQMIDAPFGGRLGFRLGAANVIPTPGLYYYRIQYRHELDASWHDFDETVAVHYVKEAPGNPPVFPTLALGPHDVGGRKLYRFRPHEAELPSLVPVAAGETVKWPSTGFLGDIYAGFLSTAALNLPPGRYLIRTEIYDSTGAQVLPGAGTFRFVVPTGVAPDGTLLTDFAPAASISAGGFEFGLHVDNRPTFALIDEPRIGGIGAGECGFLRYDPADDPLTHPVRVAFHATHPDKRALLTFRIVRAHTEVPLATLSGVEVAAMAPGTIGVFGTAYTGDGNGNFSRDFTRGELLGRCVEAAFSQNLYVYAKATTGWSHRITSLDSQDVFAFALTPR